MEARIPKTTSKAGYDLTPISAGEAAALVKAKKLSIIQRHVMLASGTEPPFTGRTINGYKHSNKHQGTYSCALCGLPSYSSNHKFNSGTGWPSFYKPIDPDHVWEKTDTLHGVIRMEVLCSRCHAHQGHVFKDGPPPTNLRYCINASALSFTPAIAGEPLGEYSDGVWSRLSRIIMPKRGKI